MPAILSGRFHDRRNAEQLRRHDNLEEKRFAVRVGRNPKERARVAPLEITRIQVTGSDIERARLAPVRAEAWRDRLRQYRERFKLPDCLRLQA